MNVISFFKKIANNALDIVFPENIKCLLCENELDNDDEIFCSQCLEQDIFNEGTRCVYCDSMIKDGNKVCDFCKNHRHLFNKCVCPLNYNPLVKRAILKFKEDNAKYLAQPFAKLIYQRLKEENITFDFIVPVPSHIKTIKKRGYNPAELLAEELSKLAKVPVYKILIKNTQTTNQKFLEYSKRFQNIQYSMSLTSKDFIKRRNILLVDDVITTCATIDACANLLVNTKNIYACAVARTNLKFKY